MSRTSIVALCFLIISTVADPAVGQTDLAPLKAKLDTFRDNVQFAMRLIDRSKLEPARGERVEDLVAFGFVNLGLKAYLPAASPPRAGIQVLAAKRAPEFEANLKENLLKQIAAACGSPGPKPTKNQFALRQMRSLMVPNLYNKMLVVIASDGQLGSFGKIGLETNLKLGELFVFPVLQDTFERSFSKLPKETQNLLSGYLLR